MTIYMIHMPYDDAPRWVTCDDGETYTALVALVGGGLEGIYPNKLLDFFGHNEARLEGQPVNRLATHLCANVYGYPIVGDIVATNTDPQGDTVSVPEYIATQFFSLSEDPIRWEEAVLMTQERRKK